MAAIAGVDELSVGMHRDLGAGKPRAIRHLGRQRRERLVDKESRPRGGAEARHRKVELVDAPGPLAVGVDGEVTRPGTGGKPHAVANGIERRPLTVKTMNLDPVEPEVADKHAESARGDVDRVGMRLILPLQVAALLAAAIPLVLHEAARAARHHERLEPAVRGESEAGHAPTAVVGGQHDPALRVDGHMARACTPRRLGATRGKCSGRFIDRKRLDSAPRPAVAPGDLGDRVEHRQPRMACQERRVFGTAGEQGLREHPRVHVEQRHVDPLRCGLRCGVGTEPDGYLAGPCRGRQEHGRDTGGADGRHREKPSCCEDNG